MFVVDCVISGGLQAAKVDLAFGLSASGKNSDRVFELMKDTIKGIAEKNQEQDIQYSLIVFGQEANTEISFKDGVNVSRLKASVDVLVKPVGESSLEEGLLEARREFRRSRARADAAKILVVMVDNSEGVGEKEVVGAAEGLTRSGVRVIVVALGGEADGGELEKITSREENVVKAPADEDPENLGKDIMESVLSGKMFPCKRGPWTLGTYPMVLFPDWFSFQRRRLFPKSNLCLPYQQRGRRQTRRTG